MEEKSVMRDCLELAFGLTLVVVAIPFVFTNMLMNKLEDVIKLVRQMNEDIVP